MSPGNGSGARPLRCGTHFLSMFVKSQGVLPYATGKQSTGAQMDTLERIKQILGETLSLGERAAKLKADTPLMGGLAEFDSMAVVAVVTKLEEELGIAFDDDELSADVFSTVGALASFVDGKMNS